jgi:hypothetical protein
VADRAHAEDGYAHGARLAAREAAAGADEGLKQAPNHRGHPTASPLRASSSLWM